MLFLKSKHFFVTMLSLLFYLILSSSIYADILIPVKYKSKIIGEIWLRKIEVTKPNTVLPGIKATFTTYKPIVETAKDVNINHFNWYQVVTYDKLGVNNQNGKIIKAPYIDPICGGYGQPYPAFFDSKLPYGTEPYNYTDSYLKKLPPIFWQASTFLYKTIFEDYLGFQKNEVLKFNTYLVGVSKEGKVEKYFTGFTWSATAGATSFRISDIKQISSTPSKNVYSNKIIRHSGFCGELSYKCCWKK